MGTTQALTAEELSLLYVIKAIEEFDKKNPGNIPQGGMHEVIVENDIFELEELDNLRKSLSEKGLINEEIFITTQGNECIADFEKVLRQAIKDNKAPDSEKYSKDLLKTLSEKLKGRIEKINWQEVRDWLNPILNLVNAAASVWNAFH